MSEWNIEFDEIKPEPDHSLVVTFSEPDDTKTIKFIGEITWCRYKEQVAELQKRIDELEKQLEDAKEYEMLWKSLDGID